MIRHSFLYSEKYGPLSSLLDHGDVGKENALKMKFSYGQFLHFSLSDHTTAPTVKIMIPWVQRPIVFDIRARPKNVPSITGSKDLQNVNITLRILFRPIPDSLPNIYTTLGVDYEDRVLPSITNEVLKAVVAQFDAGELITQREMVSARYVHKCNK